MSRFLWFTVYNDSSLGLQSPSSKFVDLEIINSAHLRVNSS